MILLMNENDSNNNKSKSTHALHDKNHLTPKNPMKNP